MVYNSTDGWSDPAKTTQRFPCLTEDTMPRERMECRICGGAANSGLRICADCRKAIGRLVLRFAAVFVVITVAAFGGYRLLRTPQPSVPQELPCSGDACQQGGAPCDPPGGYWNANLKTCYTAEVGGVPGWCRTPYIGNCALTWPCMCGDENTCVQDYLHDKDVYAWRTPGCDQ